MVEFTFDALFRTTNKGLPDTANIDPYTYFSLNHFIYSLTIQIIIGLLLCGYTFMSLYRSFYKIKNQKFFPTEGEAKSEEQPENDSQSKSQKQKKSQPEQNTNDNLIYRFDQDEDQKQKQQDKEKQENQEEQEQDNIEEKEEDDVSQETTEWYLDIDHKLLYFSPFLIGFIVASNVFAANVVLVIMMILALVLFWLFNLKGYCERSPLMQLLFVLPCVAAFMVVFFQDRDMST